MNRSFVYNSSIIRKQFRSLERYQWFCPLRPVCIEIKNLLVWTFGNWGPMHEVFILHKSLGTLRVVSAKVKQDQKLNGSKKEEK